jgi:hypothetical protein
MTAAYPDPRLQLPPPIDAGPSPLLPQHLVDLFVRPSRFFTGQLALGKTPYAVLVAWCYGVAAAIDRIDQNLLRAQLGRPRPGWDNLAPFVVDSWSGFWLFVLASGAVGGLFLWWLGGWWFAVRVRWSGVAAPDRRLARLVMAYSAFVHSAPLVVATAISTFFFASYAEAFDADESYSLVLLAFPFWSAVTSYSGVRSVFGVSGWRPRLWFLILPCLLYLVAFGVLAAVFAFLGEQPAAS